MLEQLKTLAFSQVLQHPACLDKSIQTRKTIRYFFTVNTLANMVQFHITIKSSPYRHKYLTPCLVHKS